MREAPYLGDVDLTAASVRGLEEPSPLRRVLRAAGPVVQVDAPAGGRVWVVTEDSVARELLVHPGVVKDPGSAPTAWDRVGAGLEPTAADHPSLTTLDGPAHAEARRAHAPMFTAARIQEYTDHIRSVARELLAALADEADLVADFSVRFPLTVVLDLLGVPRSKVDEAKAACGQLGLDQGDAIRRLLAVAGTAEGPGIAQQLRQRMPDDTPDDEVTYYVLAMLVAGQITTDRSVGFVVARHLSAPTDEPAAEFVRGVLRDHPAAPFGLWRFTTAEVDLGGVRVPAGAPILAHTDGINETTARDLTFGAGHHYCLGVHLAQLELTVLVEVLRADYPDARLLVPGSELRQVMPGTIQGARVETLPVRLRG
ncbi:cytochrome P450 [Actinokineospora auranticolor]|uniref:Cytochrome P450 n=1 Tax=Actinokineospora auranticolor TaxID=155976 RepID=A0A2S6GCN3_9PSEU|nr:cytochrome P450 [Actinokineospora auranticolor]PPK62562.1 cytochrome P450 [Actinokineospora auranticolor]